MKILIILIILFLLAVPFMSLTIRPNSMLYGDPMIEPPAPKDVTHD